MTLPPTLLNPCKLKKIAIIIVLLKLVILPTSLYANDNYVIFSLDPEFTEISIHKARKLYKGKSKRLNGKRVELSDWPENSQERASFYQNLLGKNTAQMNAHWASLSFSGKVRYPKELDKANINVLIQWLKAKPNRIGYARLTSLPKNATILYIVNSDN
ncbi:hypothetical protein HQQ94_12895 [Shewanella sp. VB17]|uniref:hypothetical protein n=1 Tax=Shewanella sp. VB17 TaxID=2739432 RepID=UPI001564A6BD|nr:hypothetical protein [Shewanella sp. VB17]NRD74117.1 hypothetical protein [Shewanella sp. VB17]